MMIRQNVVSGLTHDNIFICNILILFLFSSYSIKISYLLIKLLMICTTPQMNVCQEHTEMQTCLHVLVVMRTLSVLQEHLLVLLVMLEL